MSNERDTWWLVERRGCQLWATGRGSFHGLTNDASRAEWFATRFEAEEEIRCAEDNFRNELVATEHKFIDTGVSLDLLLAERRLTEEVSRQRDDLALEVKRLKGDGPDPEGTNAQLLANALSRAEAAESELAALRAECDRLREALEPFAEAATKGEIGGYPPNYFVGATEFENARRARTALDGRE